MRYIIFVLLVIATVFAFTGCLTTEQPGEIIQDETKSSEVVSTYYKVLPFGDIEYNNYILVNDPEISKYAFIYYIPDTALTGDIVKTVYMGHSALKGMRYSEVVKSVMNNYSWSAPYAEEYGYAMLTVILPRKAIYIERENMIADEIDNPLFERPDLEYKKVISVFIDKLRTAGHIPHEKVFMTGFSSGGIQSNTFSLLHPEMVEATAIGSAGVYAYPVEVLNGVDLHWPLGLSDLEKIDGARFKVDLFKEVEHFVFVGEADVNNDPLEFKYDEYKAKLGVDTVARVPIFVKYLEEYGVDSDYKVYDGVGHKLTPEMMHDTFAFFDSVEF